MIDPKDALATIPEGLRNPLLSEFSKIVQNFAERRWGPSELSGGLFCEIVYTILLGHATSKYADKPSKPDNFVMSCRALEQNKHVPRSFQILIPRLLPALYEIRNNRGVGHVGGDVDPNPMDAAAVRSMTSWVLAELVRVYHALDVAQAQQLVDALSERPLALVWVGDGTKRVLDPKITINNQILILLGSSTNPVSVDELQSWLKYKNKAYLNRLVASLDERRLVYISANDGKIQLLPPGVDALAEILAQRNAS